MKVFVIYFLDTLNTMIIVLTLRHIILSECIERFSMIFNRIHEQSKISIFYAILLDFYEKKVNFYLKLHSDILQKTSSYSIMSV